MSSKLLTPERFSVRKQAVQRVLDARAVQHFGPNELYRHTHDDWPWGRLYPPTTRLAPQIGPTVELADRIREEWGGPVRVVSGYRTTAYNDLLRNDDSEHAGSEDSQHLYFRAVDLQPVEPRSEDYSEWVAHCEDIVHDARTSGRIVGFGRYSSFIHLDCGHYDYNRNWHPRSE